MPLDASSWFVSKRLPQILHQMIGIACLRDEVAPPWIGAPDVAAGTNGDQHFAERPGAVVAPTGELAERDVWRLSRGVQLRGPPVRIAGGVDVSARRLDGAEEQLAEVAQLTVVERCQSLAQFRRRVGVPSEQEQ